MFKRGLLAIIFLLSLAWIGFIGFDLFQNGNEYAQEYIFGEEDQQLLIVNRASEVTFDQIDVFSNAPMLDIIQSLDDSLYEVGYFSSKRAHFMLQGVKNWTPENISLLFSASAIKPTNISSEAFSLGKFNGRYRKGKLYIWDSNIQGLKNATDAFKYDKKASASLIDLSPTGKHEVSDIYFKPDGKVNYITKDNQIVQGKQINDEVIFAGYISTKIKTYHFFEHEYRRTSDSVYATSPMAQWCQSGFVEVSYGSETVLVSDYIGGQDPILVLNDLIQTQDLNRFNVPLTKDFPRNQREYTVKYLDDLVVISYSEATCDQFIADYKLGQTIGLSEKKSKTIYGNLPLLVSERHYSNDTHYSRAVYKGYLLETRLGNEPIETPTILPQSVAMPCNFDIADFVVLTGTGNTVALGRKGEIIAFNQGKEKWKKELNEAVIGDLQLIDLHGNNENHILVNTEDAIHVWNENGTEVSGFPIKLEHSAVNQVKFYRWKKKSYFLIATENNQIIHYDAQGRELNIFTPKILPTRQIDVWASQSKLFAGFGNDTDFEMFSMAKRKSHRSFSLNGKGTSGKVRNQLLHFTMNNDVLSMFDQKGTRSDFQKYPNGIIYDVHNNSNNPTIIIRARNEVYFINQQGVPFGKLRLPFNEIDHIAFTTLNSGKTIIGIIDGLENSVYLYRIDGSQLRQKPFEGKTKVDIQSEESGLKITTVVDQFLIQYLNN